MFSRARGVNCEKKQLLTLKPGMYHEQAIRIRTHRNEPIWHLLRSYINNLDRNALFNRHDLLSCVYTIEVVEGGITACQTTVDQYRRYLTLAKVLDRVGMGEYKKIKNIPENLSVHKLKKHVYGSTWQTWFIPIEDI
jgi:hypothetical protein